MSPLPAIAVLAAFSCVLSGKASMSCKRNEHSLEEAWKVIQDIDAAVQRLRENQGLGER